MNIAKALKVKNRLIGELKSLRERFASVNAQSNTVTWTKGAGFFKTIQLIKEKQ